MCNSASFIGAACRAHRPRTHFGPRRFWILSILGMLTLFVSSFPASVQAQKISSQTRVAEEGWAMLLDQEGEWTRPFTGEALPSTLSGIDLPHLTKEQWKALQKEQLAALRSQDAQVWQEALQNIIYLSRFYRNEVDFGRASTPVLEIYIFDRNERHRIMALAGLHAVGNRNVMAHLAQRVQLEGSHRVRRLTLAALADHYGIRDYYARREGSVIVGQPARAKGQ